MGYAIVGFLPLGFGFPFGYIGFLGLGFGLWLVGMSFL
jgi:hypothetical protein